MPGGRPPKFQPEFVEQGRKLANLGATDREIAEFFEMVIADRKLANLRPLWASANIRKGAKYVAA